MVNIAISIINHVLSRPFNGKAPKFVLILPLPIAFSNSQNNCRSEFLHAMAVALLSKVTYVTHECDAGAR